MISEKNSFKKVKDNSCSTINLILKHILEGIFRKGQGIFNKGKRILGKTEILRSIKGGNAYPINWENEENLFDFQILSQQSNSFLFQFSLYSINQKKRQRRKEAFELNLFSDFQQYDSFKVNYFEHCLAFPESKTEFKWLLLISQTPSELAFSTKRHCTKYFIDIPRLKQNEVKNEENIQQSEENPIIQTAVQEEKTAAIVNQQDKVQQAPQEQVRKEEEENKDEIKPTEKINNFQKKSLKKSAFILIIALFIAMFFGNFIMSNGGKSEKLKKPKSKK